jgi:23S rRNA (adenine-N6)-dimethyltransferase
VARHGPAGRGPRTRSERDLRRRQLGQNLLTDPRVAARVVHLADVARGDLVVDVGAGRGALTGPLLDRGARVIAIEVDPAMVDALLAEVAGSAGAAGSIGRGRLEVVRADALEVALPSEPFRVVANPPFGLTTSLLRRLLGGDAPLRDATLVLQQQTARRVSGAPAVGRFSLGWTPWFEMRVLERIDRRAFRPVPSADAAVLQVRPRAVPWLSPARYADWDRFVDRVFRASGRTAADRLDVVLGPRAARRLAAAAEVDPVRPPSRLPAEAWLALFRSLPPRS